MRPILIGIAIVGALLLAACGGGGAEEQDSAVTNELLEARSSPPSRGEKEAQRLLEGAFHESARCELQGSRTNNLQSERRFACRLRNGNEDEMYVTVPGRSFQFGYCSGYTRRGHVHGGCVTPSVIEE